MGQFKLIVKQFFIGHEQLRNKRMNVTERRHVVLRRFMSKDKQKVDLQGPAYTKIGDFDMKVPDWGGTSC